MVPGQPSTDRPDIVAPMFKIKLDELMNDIRKKHHFGRTKAELPSQENDLVAFEAVRSHMIHGPCGQLNTLIPCMHNGSCSKGYPKEYCDETFIRRDGWPCYKRSNDGSKVKVGNEDIMLDNRYVVPHNVELLVKYGCHINVEYCNQGSLIKYLFSYINKGHDRATAVLEGPDRTRYFISMLHHENEIEEYINCRYICVSDSCWKLLGSEMQYRSVVVERLPFHEEDCQRVYFREDDDIAEVLDRRVSVVSKFTEWMRANQLYPEVRLLTYSDFPTKFTWHEKGDVKEWRPCKNGLVIGQLYFVNPNEGERYYLRMLLNVVRGPCSFKDIRTVDGVEHPTYMSACKALRLLGDDCEWLESIREASQWQSGNQLRELFVIILLFCGVTDQAKFFWDCFPFLSEDVAYNQRRLLDNEDLMFSHDELVNYTLLYIDNILYGNCHSLVDFPNLPQLNHSLLTILSNRLIAAERAYNVEEEIIIFNELYSGLNVQHKEVYTLIINAVTEKTEDLWNSCCFFVLTTNMRLSDQNITGTGLIKMCEFSKWILDMGVGRLPTCIVEGEDDATWITIPDDLLIPVADNPIDDVASIVFPDILSRVNDISYIKERCIICPKNDDVDMINLHVLCKMSGDMHEMLSADEICRSTDKFAELEIMYSLEFLNTLRFT
ncbi:unnamed protein product [Lactuca virosa]|uniref:ATP-dependent DNA helicase n=1 Tax=Lactuca virosa TaxID=75947 RepID=A0AAU9NB77_9ASTR|nr:unnamed protein product [Lactuca virosa]